MMKTTFLSLWLLVPVGVGAYHFGPGQDQVLLDDAGALLAEAEDFAREGAAQAESDERASKAAFTQAKAKFEEALSLLPEDQVAMRRQVRLELAKCRMETTELPQANGQLAVLIEELCADPLADPVVLESARSAYASSQYYMTWLLRLEGATRDQWEPRVESARQTYRLLAERAEERGDVPAAAQHTEDLEAAVRLARMDLDELQGLPLPSQ